MRNDLDLPVALLGDLHDVAEVADAAVDLDLVVQELLEGGDVEDLVACGLRGIDDELRQVKEALESQASVGREQSYLLGYLLLLPLGGSASGFLSSTGLSLSLLFSSLVPEMGTGGQQSGVMVYVLLQEPLLELVAKKCVSCALCRCRICRIWPDVVVGC